MNGERLREMQKWLLNQEESRYNLDMMRWFRQHNCGTSCCLAGYAVETWGVGFRRGYPGRLNNGLENIFEYAMELLGLSEKEATSLFLPGRTYERTTDEAYLAIDNLIAGRAVLWSD